MNIKYADYFSIVRRPYPPLISSVMMSGYRESKHFEPFCGRPYSMDDLIVANQGAWYYHRAEFELAANLVFKYWQDSVVLESVKKEFLLRESRLIESTNGIFSEYCDALESYMPALLLVWCPEALLTEDINRLLRLKATDSDAMSIMDKLNTPLEDNYSKQLIYELLTNPDTKYVVSKFEWINSRYGEHNPLTVDEAKQKIAGLDKHQYLAERESEKERVKEAISGAKNIVGEENSIIVDIIQFLIYYRTQRTDVINKSIYLFYEQLCKIAKEKNVSYQDLLLCTKDEVNNLLPSADEIKRRRENQAVVMDRGEIKCYSGDPAQEICDGFSEEHTDRREFSGTVAARGNVKGRAKIVFGPNDYAKISKGDVIVTNMTTPNMGPILDLAGAFVTDEGGITCHAAIISREMKKPCIIGTKIATKVLHDGDMIEVDANNGVVRKI